MEKKDVEELLKCSISDEMYREALESARRKQRYIFSQEHRAVVLQDWYLLQLTMEAVISLTFQKFTLDYAKRFAIWKKSARPMIRHPYTQPYCSTANRTKSIETYNMEVHLWKTDLMLLQKFRESMPDAIC